MIESFNEINYEDIKNCIDDWIASKDEAFFRRRIHMVPER